MEKRLFEEAESSIESLHLPKKEFDSATVVIEEEQEKALDEVVITDIVKPPRFWLRLFLGGLALLMLAVIAQSVQWLIDTWLEKQWIAFVFAVGFFGVSLAGVGAIVNEWRKLRALRAHYYRQQQSQAFRLDVNTSGENAQKFCQMVLAHMSNAVVQRNAERWSAQLNEGYNAQEVLYLFEENVLKPLDEQVKKQISKSAVENALIVAVSPLAWVDVLMIAWRNLALVNQITRAYGMELGYISRLRLFKMVLMNMAFAGATEIATDLGADFFTQNLTAKFSMRTAQCIGVGLLTARLGLKAMEFCRPITFQENERPKLSVVRQTLLSALKTQFFSATAEKSREDMF